MARLHDATERRRYSASVPGRRGATVAASAASTGAAGFPAIVPASVLGADSPGNRINIGAIGTGGSRAGTICRALWKHDSARIMAVVRSGQPRVADAQNADQRPLLQEDRQAYDGVTTYTRLSRAAREPRRRRRGDQHAGSLARDHRHPCRPGRQGRVPAEAGVAHDCRGPRPQRRGPPLGPHLPDRQPAAILSAVPLCRRACAQRPDRPAEDGRSRPARAIRQETTSRPCRSRRT